MSNNPKNKEKQRAYRYLPAYIFGVIALLSFHYQGITLYLLPIISFGIIPILELILDTSQLSLEVNRPLIFKIVLYSILPFQLIIVFTFLHMVSNEMLQTSELIGAIITMGICCGVYGINAAHELGHKKMKFEQIFAQILLATSLYMHFFIEHNRGHHKKVGTVSDPATAPKNETLYKFWLRCIYQSFISARNLEIARLKNSNKPIYGLQNQWLRFLLMQIVLLFVIYIFFGLLPLISFIAAAILGILLLETINYIEHYGLTRKVNKHNIPELMNETHSWNSDHVLGRYLLFELTRHSHHHLNSSLAYFELNSLQKSPQLPTGYPGMMLLSLIPPLWFKVMNKRLLSN